MIFRVGGFSAIGTPFFAPTQAGTESFASAITTVRPDKHFIVWPVLGREARMMFRLMVLVSTLLATAGATTLDKQCSCGFQDPTTKNVYTDALIVYFNETKAIDDDLFLLQDFEHKKEQGWKCVK